MENIYAAMLLHSAKKQITEENLKKVLTSAGVKVDSAKVKALVATLSEVKIDEAIKAAPTLAAAPAPAAAATATAPKAEGKKKEEKKEDKKEEEAALEGLGSLFGS